MFSSCEQMVNIHANSSRAHQYSTMYLLDTISDTWSCFWVNTRYYSDYSDNKPIIILFSNRCRPMILTVWQQPLPLALFTVNILLVGVFRVKYWQISCCQEFCVLGKIKWGPVMSPLHMLFIFGPVSVMSLFNCLNLSDPNSKQTRSFQLY